LLFLIIFAWTPHFWALSIGSSVRKGRRAMLPVTHGDKFTRLHVLFYTVISWRSRAAAVRHERAHLCRCAALGGVFLYYAFRIFRDYSDRLAQRRSATRSCI
jgi:protoheme IX farnesyltransferase